MSKENEKQSSMSSLMPLLFMGAATFFLLQYFNTDETKNQKNKPGEVVSLKKENESTKLQDFVFTSGNGDQQVLKTNNYIAVFSARGGRIEKLYLKSNESLKIPPSVIKEKNDALGIENQALEVSRGNGFDFQPHLYYKKSHSDEIIQIDNPPLNEAAFKREGPFIDQNTGIQEIRFTLPLLLKGQKLELIKIYRLLQGEYYFHQITLLRNTDKKPFEWAGDLFYKYTGDIGPSPDEDDTYSFSKFTRFYYYADSMTTEPAITSGGNGNSMSCMASSFCGSKNGNEHFHAVINSPNTLRLAGSTSKYFFSYNKFLGNESGTLSTPDGIIMVKEKDEKGRKSHTVFFSKIQIEPSQSDVFTVPGLASGEENTGAAYYTKIRELQKRKDLILMDNMVYVGVRRDESHVFRNKDMIKSEFGLEEPDSDAREVIYSSGFFTIFSGIRDGVVWLMRHLYTLIGNYGWVIIIMASGLKLVTWPLNQMQAKSMKRMSALKPEIELINEKYKDNPTEKQKQIMQLYKKNNVNPAKGCLPMLIQLPVFIALYSAFSDSIELWRSPFIFWMTDLSRPDTVLFIEQFLILKNFHLNILPLMMVVSQVLQQIFTTVVTDPQQKTIMYIMPVVMIFFFWNMPSGVTLYWTVQNVISIIWQLAVEKFSKDEKKA